MEEHTCFYDQNFLQTYNLTTDNVIAYFSASQFYDKECINEILKMQSQFANIDISSKLTTTVGFYYVLEDYAENLFIIAKKENNGTETRLLRLYYCLFGYIYCAPTARGIYEYRMSELFWHLNTALDLYIANKRFNWADGRGELGGASGIEGKEETEREMLDALYDFERRKKL